MLKEISWTDYVTGVVSVLFVYYALVILLYYRSGLPNLLKARIRPENRNVADTGPADPAERNLVPLFDDLKAFLKEIDSTLEKAGNPASKQELLPLLKHQLANFAGLRHPAYRDAVMDHIIKNAAERCGIRFSVMELSNS